MYLLDVPSPSSPLLPSWDFENPKNRDDKYARRILLRYASRSVSKYKKNMRTLSRSRNKAWQKRSLPSIENIERFVVEAYLNGADVLELTQDAKSSLIHNSNPTLYMKALCRAQQTTEHLANFSKSNNIPRWLLRDMIYTFLPQDKDAVWTESAARHIRSVVQYAWKNQKKR